MKLLSHFKSMVCKPECISSQLKFNIASLLLQKIDAQRATNRRTTSYKLAFKKLKIGANVVSAVLVPADFEVCFR